ncbi:AmmeMemoRadiSam system radical SAM enzyme [Primorskyibacter sp. 2E233]|uniref:AmmeMemoRadiSam system radical SAM enzyme n=1 Tax=Primorskyibacter sp. 2E233 TaxID=3413431 RepID=UPI003BF14AB6
MTQIARYWETAQDGRIICTLCPRLCALRDGQRGMCFVRKREGDGLVLDTYGRSSGFCIDPIEKKPLNHFYPGTPVLSFGTAGCNLACKFCQNHDISKSRDMDKTAQEAAPERIASRARDLGCTSVAYTYNDPVIFIEYATDTAKACRELEIRNVAVTAAYMTPQARPEFFGAMDAANIDLKGFTDRFYQKLTGSRLAPVLDSISYAVQETSCWVELTTLIIPGENDSAAELRELAAWVLSACGPDVPLHFSAFTPQFRMTETPKTSVNALLRARAIAKEAGLRHVYVGNVHHEAAQSSYCAGCGTCVIGRDWYALSRWHLDARGKCLDCGTQLPGRFDGPPGDWGRKRQPVQM